jgi:hypothetical protein
MQFTSLGILDESEVTSAINSQPNPAANAQPVGAPIVFPPPQVAPNNAPVKDVTTVVPALPAPPATIRESRILNAGDYNPSPAEVVAEGVKALAARPVGQTAQERASAETSANNPAILPDIQTPASFVTSIVAPVTNESQPDIQPDIKAEKPKRARRTKNTVSLEGPEPEIVNAVSPKAPISASTETASISENVVSNVVPPQAVPVVPQQAIAVPVPGTSVPNLDTDFPGKPTKEQMDTLRKRVSVYTSELPSSENLGSPQKMRAFITKMSGTAPAFMTLEQWEDQLAWFESFVERNKIKGLVTYINDILGVK